MKKVLLISFAFFYLMLASGVHLSMHYCGNKLKDISFFNSGDEDGCCGTKKKSKGCCNETTAFIKVKDNHFAGNNLKIFKNPVSLVPTVFFNQLFEIRDINICYSDLNYHAPPVLYDNPLYLQHRVLII